ncbi:hypothetical protein M2166_000223 [Bacillus sp. TBS-096]|nr:hypothetical protein [Bacillus sp. TBS-096]
MKREDLIAPEQYNLVSEIEAFSHDKRRKWPCTGRTAMATKRM